MPVQPRANNCWRRRPSTSAMARDRLLWLAFSCSLARARLAQPATALMTRTCLIVRTGVLFIRGIIIFTFCKVYFKTCIIVPCTILLAKDDNHGDPDYGVAREVSCPARVSMLSCSRAAP